LICCDLGAHFDLQSGFGRLDEPFPGTTKVRAVGRRKVPLDLFVRHFGLRLVFLLDQIADGIIQFFCCCNEFCTIVRVNDRWFSSDTDEESEG
jgi:hypothetical protein